MTTLTEIFGLSFPKRPFVRVTEGLQRLRPNSR